MEKITAEDARKLTTDNRKQSENLKWIYNRIKEAAEKGEFSIETSEGNLDDDDIRILEADGFKVSYQDYLRDYTISW